MLESCGQKFDDIDGCDSGFGVVPVPPQGRHQPVSDLASELEAETTSTVAISQGENCHQGAPADSERYSWAKDLLSSPSVAIYGPQGSGKSTFAAWLLEQCLNAGHQIEILDPHKQAGQWEGLLVFGEGLDYAAIDSRLRAFSQLIHIRQQQRSKQPGLPMQPVTILAEDFSRRASKCEHSAAFIEDTRTDIRKVSCHVVFVGHKIISTLLLLGLFSAPGALWMLMSGIFFADRQLPQNAPIAERATNELGRKLIRPVATTVIVTAEAASRAGYQPAAAKRQAPVSSRLSASDTKALQRFAQQNGGVLVRFDR